MLHSLIEFFTKIPLVWWLFGFGGRPINTSKGYPTKISFGLCAYVFLMHITYLQLAFAGYSFSIDKKFAELSSFCSPFGGLALLLSLRQTMWHSLRHLDYMTNTDSLDVYGEMAKNLDAFQIIWHQKNFVGGGGSTGKMIKLAFFTSDESIMYLLGILI